MSKPPLTRPSWWDADLARDLLKERVAITAHLGGARVRLSGEPLLRHDGRGGLLQSVRLRVDHPDGTRSWTVLLPSTQAMAPGGRNPVDNLTNVEAYGELVSDVEIGAARAMELAGIRPGTRVALEGPYGIFSEASRSRSRLVLVAAGIGVTPVRSLLESARFRPGEATVLLRSPPRVVMRLAELVDLKAVRVQEPR